MGTTPLERQGKEMPNGNDPTWISSRFDLRRLNGGSQFFIDGVSIETIAKEVLPPFFVYSARDIKDRYEALTSALAPCNITVYFSMKANSARAVVAGLKKLGAGLEIASIGELAIAKSVRADPKRVSFAGPVKTREELEAAIRWGIGTINGEQRIEFERISAIAGELGKRQKVGIRVNPENEVSGAGGLMGGGPQKFGIDVEKLTPEFIGMIKKFPNIDLSGIHVFAATQMLNVEAFLNNLRNVCDVAQRLNAYFPIQYIDFGGGLGIPYKPSDPKLPLDQIAKALKATLSQYPFLEENHTKLYVEPGRFLTGPSGIYIARVDHVKDSRGVTYAMVDGGWHHMMRTAPKMPFSQHPVYNLSKLGETDNKAMSIGGSLCTSIDLLGIDIQLPENTQEGDLIGVFNAGAYGRSQSPRDFLSHPTSAEVLVGNGRFVVIRPSEHPEGLLNNQKVPRKNLFQ